MKTIADIRLYRGRVENINGNTFPEGLEDYALNIKLHRVVMKLREQGFSFGDFTHLYINFTPLVPEGACAPAGRSVDRGCPWFRYYDAGVRAEVLDALGTPETETLLLGLVERVLLLFFAENDAAAERIQSAFAEALSLGDRMCMRFREKTGAKTDAVLYLRYTDSGKYLPLLRVYDKGGRVLLNADLPVVNTLDTIGELRLSAKKVTILPRKNAYSAGLTPLSFEL